MIVDDPDRPTPLAAGGPNAISVMLDLAGDEWNLQLLRHALAGVTRYGEFHRRLPISHAVLSSRLERLGELGLLERTAYRSQPVRFEYTLTGRGRETWPILTAIWMWERAWGRGERPLPLAVHPRCGGHDVRFVLGCGACGEEVAPGDVLGRFGHSGGWERSLPRATTRRRAAGRRSAEFPAAMAVLGNRWSAAIVGSMLLGVHRFSDFERRLGIPPTILSERLANLVDHGVVHPVPSAERDDWHDYRLSPAGEHLTPLVVHAFAWAQRWFRAPEGPAFEVRHRTCGAVLDPCVVCADCGGRVSADEVGVVGVVAPTDLGAGAARR